MYGPSGPEARPGLITWTAGGQFAKQTRNIDRAGGTIGGLMNRAKEQVLIRKAKAGDGEAIAALIRSHQDALYAFILRQQRVQDVDGKIPAAR